MAKKGVVTLPGGRKYKTVALRVSEWREMCPGATGWGMVTDIVEQVEDLVIFRACILDPEQRVVATGHSSGSTRGQKAFEKLETVAVGRALAAFGLAGDEYASADEMRAWMEARENPTPQNKGQGYHGEGDEPIREDDNPFDGDGWKRELEQLGLGYAQVNRWLKAKGKPMPWDMTREQRAAALGYFARQEEVVEEVHRMFPQGGE